MDWDAHERWAERLGIDREVAGYVNRIIDVDSKDDLPADCCQDIKRWNQMKAARDGAKSGNSALSLVMNHYTMNRHDGGQGSRTADRMTGKAIRYHLRKQGPEYIAAYYLHHHLDFLSEHRSDSGSIEGLLERHKHSSSYPYHETIAEKLRTHSKALGTELGVSASW